MSIIPAVLTRRDIQKLEEGTISLADVIDRDVVTAFPDEPLRLVVYRMADTAVTRMPIVDRQDPRRVVGMISLADLLRARTRDLDAERRRERILRLRLPFGLVEADKPQAQ